MTTHHEHSTSGHPDVGVIGVGEMGSAIAQNLGSRGVRVQIANSRGPATLDGLARANPGLLPVPVVDALGCDIVILSVPWSAVADVLAAAPAWDGRVLVDVTNAVEFLAPGSPDASDPDNPLAPLGLKAVDLQGSSSSRVVARLAPGAHVVKTLNHLEPRRVQSPRTDPGRGVVFLAGDDRAAREEVAALLEHMGFAPADLGALDPGGRLFAFPDGSLAQLDLAQVQP